MASTVTVVIKASDGAYGKFQFSDSALLVNTEELGDSGYSSVYLQVILKYILYNLIIKQVCVIVIVSMVGMVIEM